MNDYSTGGGEAPVVGEAIFQKRAELNQEIIDGIGPNSWKPWDRPRNLNSNP